MLGFIFTFVALSQLVVVAVMSTPGVNRSLEAMVDLSSCVTESGFDYVGNDISVAGSNTPDGCCVYCQILSGSRAYSWVREDEIGACYFKSGRGTIVAKAGVMSGIVSTVSTTCAIDQGIDYVDNDIGSAASVEPSGCCSACQSFPGCRAYPHTSVNGGTCWLKSEKGRMVVSSDARSAEVYVEEPTCGLESGYNYVGNDIGSASASSPGECCDKCSSWNGCRAFSWTNYNGGTCYLKNLKGDVVAAAGVTSAQVVANPPAPSCALEEGVDYVGNDIGSASSSDAYGCCSICMARSGCGAFTWTSYNGGTCYLKSGKVSTKSDASVKSAVV